MVNIPLPDGPIDLTELDEFLISDEAPENCMGLSDLDGFLTGIIIGPELILPSEWMPVIWGGEGPDFANMRQAQSILGAIMGRYNEISFQLDAGPGALEPIYEQWPDGMVVVTDWAAGLVDSMKLRPKPWMTLLRDPETADAFSTMVRIGSDDYRKPEFGLPPISDDDLAKLLAEGEMFITDFVYRFRDYWRKHSAWTRGRKRGRANRPQRRQRDA